MPLKHATETFLIFLLGVVILVTGILLSTLPDLPAGAVPWAILFVLALLYPLSLFLLFRNRRADHAFRLLHWYPALMLLVWLGLEVAALERPRLLAFVDYFTWGWTLPAVVLAFILLITYCLQVVRRRGLRVLLLLLAFIPYVSMGLASERSFHWEPQLASLLWNGNWLASLEGKDFFGFHIAQKLPLKQNLNSSQDQSEESWRVKLREAEQRRSEIAEKIKNQSGSVALAIVAPSSAGSGATLSMGTTAKKPHRLSSSGPEDIGAFALLLIAGYTFVLHERARRRA